MSKINNKEVEYLKKKISEVSYNPKRFKVFFGEDRFLFGVISPEGEETPFSKLMQYKAVYDTLQNLDWKIKISLKKGIDYAYSELVQENFSLVNINTEEESLAYYYIENALFRTSSLWEMLAQLYCLFYEINIRKDRIYYNKIFNPDLSLAAKFKEKAIEINNYIRQEDETGIEGEWKGNHKYTNDCRNKMTHRNSPNVTTISDYDCNFKDHPSFILKRVIEDYAVVSKYLREMLDEIEKKVLKDKS